MQAITTEIAPITAPPRAAVTFEAIAYALLIAFALVLRLAEIDTVPLSDGEARQALAAWRVVYPEAPGSEIVPESPILFLLHGLSFSALGTSEFYVRWATALAGTFLVFAPLLFRDLLGQARTFAFVLMLLFSPVFLLASRFDAPAIWSLTSAVLGLWSLRRYWLTQSPAYTLFAAAFFTGTALLTDPGGLTLVVILLLAGGLAVAWTRLEEPDGELLPELRIRFNTVSWQRVVITAALTLLAVSTVFGLYLPGLSSVSESLFVGLRASVSDNAGMPFFYPIIVALVYEPVTWIFGIVAVILMARRGAVTLIERFLIVWLVAALVAGIFYDRAEYAMWIILPLIGLGSSLVPSLLARDHHPFYDPPLWGKPALALVVVGLLAVFTIHFQTIARSFTSVPGGELERVVIDPYNSIWAIIALALIGLAFFMVSGLWGQTTALRGIALGLLVFGLVTSLGAGWNAAVPNAANATELWHTRTTGREVFFLRNLFIELSKRETGGVPRIPVTVLAPEDGVIAWTLRDFTNTRFIIDVGEARAQEIVLLPESPEPPDLGGSYVGQDFVITREWDPRTMLGLDIFSWWTQRRTRTPQSLTQTMVLWLRQDIYDGVPFEEVNIAE